MDEAPLRAVYYSRGGRKYHGDRDCPALESGRRLWGGCSPQEDPYAAWLNAGAVLQRHEMDVFYKERKRPCLVCLPGRGIPFAAEHDFGHEPVRQYVRGRFLQDVCARCRVVHWQSDWEVDGDVLRAAGFSYVKWPCASALVLGVADREAAVMTGLAA
ncbi:hypothetical protein [Streptomyces griseoaurantiacus]|uniref:hypothetical protein n=1 Tax=Streptomyces griseoaurantiacus TaxID=68213 RepID=UPI0036C44A48